MKKSRFTDSQIAEALKRVEAGLAFPIYHPKKALISESIIAITYNSTYHCAELNGEVSLNRNKLGNWETFRLINDLKYS